MWSIQVKVQNLWFYYMISPLWSSHRQDATPFFPSRAAAEFELARLRREGLKYAEAAAVVELA